jgi:hypothetical protein
LSIFTNKYVSNFANNKGVRNFASKMCSPGVLLPVVMLEGTVIAGRTYQAHKRGGEIEARERFTEETVSSVCWLWGVQAVNKAFDFLIDKVGQIKKKTKLKDFGFDTGRDHIREPFMQATKDMTPNGKKLVAALKFSKIVASAALTVGFMGFVLPKINQNITKKKLKKAKKTTGQHLQPIKIEPHQKRKMEINEFLTMSRGSAGDPKFSSSRSAKDMDINEFLTMSRGSAGDPTHSSRQSKEMDTNDNLVMSRGQAGDPTTFSNGTFFELAAHSLENNNIVQLLTQDAGLFTGRALNARNEYERNEILFRDLTSSFFYVFATPLIYKGLCKLDSLRGKNTNLMPNRADEFHAHMDGILGSKDSMSAKDFEAKLLGTQQVSDDVLKGAVKEFDDKGVASVAKMHEFIDKNLSKEPEKAALLKEKAIKLSALQPEKNGQKILTKSQLTNLFHNGLVNEPTVINNLINNSTGGKAMNRIKFVPQGKVDEARKTVVDYAQSIVQRAKAKKKDVISKDFLKEMKTRNLVTKLGYWGVGMAVSAYFLSTAIPKMQYWMTQKATGHNDFPGIQTYEKHKTKQPKN